MGGENNGGRMTHTFDTDTVIGIAHCCHTETAALSLVVRRRGRRRLRGNELRREI